MNPKVKIIAVSGLKQDEDLFEQHSVKFLYTPYTAEKLLNVLRDVIVKS